MLKVVRTDNGTLNETQFAAQILASHQRKNWRDWLLRQLTRCLSKTIELNDLKRCKLSHLERIS